MHSINSLLRRTRRHLAGAALTVAAVLCAAAASAQLTATAAADADALFGAPRMVDTAAGRLAVYQVGTGAEAVVYWGSVMTDHTIYHHQARQLRADTRQVFIDGPGHGASGPQAAGASLQTHAQAVLQVMDTLELRQVTFVGSSWGGLVGALVARQAPQRVRALVALNTPFETHADGPLFTERLTVWMARLMCRSDLFAAGSADAFFSRQTLAGKTDAVALFKSRLAGADCKALSDAVRTVLLERASTAPWLPELAVKTVLVAGADDAVYPPQRSRRAADLIPQASLEVLAGAAHLAALEAPEEVTRIIRGAMR